MRKVSPKWILFFILLIVVIFSVIPVSAAIRPGSSELSLNLGVLRGDDFGSVEVFFPDDPLTPEDESEVVTFATNLEDELFIGFRYTYNFTSRLATELELALIPGAAVNASDLGELFEVDIRFFNANAVFHLLKGSFVPFATAGIGIADFKSETIDGTTFIDESNFAFNFGGGFKIFLTDTFILRADIRDYLTTPEDLDELSLIEISGGVGFLF